MTNTMSEDRLRNVRAWAASRPDMSGSEVIVGAIDELLHLREVLTFPIITPEATSSALFIRTLREHEKGQPVNGQDLINALMWRVKNQRQEIARLQQVVADKEDDCARLHKQFMDAKYGPSVEPSEIRLLFNKAVGLQNGNRFSFGFPTEEEANQAFHYIAELGTLETSQPPSSMNSAGKTTVRNDALAHIAQAVKPAEPAALSGSDLRSTGDSVRKRVPSGSSEEPPHTTEDDFLHFLSYEQLSRQPAEELDRLRRAYYAGADAPPPPKSARSIVQGADFVLAPPGETNSTPEPWTCKCGAPDCPYCGYGRDQR